LASATVASTKPSMETTAAKWAVGICFFVSGATGLIYENIWVRILGLFYGNTTLAVSAVLTAFMGGLALGAWMIGGRSDRLRRPVAVYGLLETLIGLCGLASPRLLELARSYYVTSIAPRDLPELALTLIQFGLCAAILVVPTALMGMTLPILSAGLQRVLGSGQKTVGSLYAINTFGAVAGTFLIGFVMLQSLGVEKSVKVAAALNVTIGILMILVGLAGIEATPGRATENEKAPAPDLIGAKVDPEKVKRSRSTLWVIMVCFFFTGLSALTLEVAWTRTLCLFIGSSVYGFALILMSFLLGLALGSWVFAVVFAKRPVTIQLFGAVAIGIGITCLLLSMVFPWLPYAFLGLYVGFTFMDLSVLYMLQFAICVTITLIPTCLMGMTFPIAAKVCADFSGKLGNAVGKSYAANTAGAIVGSALSGLVFIYYLGLQQTIIAFSLVYVVVGAVAALRGLVGGPEAGWARMWLTVGALVALAGTVVIGLGLYLVLGLDIAAAVFGLLYALVGAVAAVLGAIVGRIATVASTSPRAAGFARVSLSVAAVSLLVGSGLLASAMPQWPKGALVSGIFRRTYDQREATTGGIYSIQRPDEDVIFFKEGKSCTVSVIQGGSGRDTWKSLAVNGKTDASTLHEDMVTQQLTGHLPVLLQDTPSRCLLIGLGSGCSAAAICAHKDVRSLEVAELEEQVVEGARKLSEINRGVLEPGAEPKLTIRIMDGRTTLLGSQGTYDVVISEPSNPWISGVSNLFTVEHYEACKRALKPTGTFCQWAQGYDLDRDTMHMMFATVHSVFPNATVWQTTTADYLFVARAYGTTPDFDYARLVEEFRTNAQLREDLAPYRHDSPGGILASYVMGPRELAEISNEGSINTDDVPLLEYWAPKGLYQRAENANFDWIRGFKSNDLPKMRNFNPTDAERAVLYVQIGNALIDKRVEEEACEWALKALAIDDTRVDAWTLLGEAEWKLGNPGRALRALRRALRLDPGNVGALRLTAEANLDEGLPLAAAAAARKASELAPEDTDIANVLRRAEDAGGRLDPMLASLED